MAGLCINPAVLTLVPEAKAEVPLTLDAKAPSFIPGAPQNATQLLHFLSEVALDDKSSMEISEESYHPRSPSTEFCPPPRVPTPLLAKAWANATPNSSASTDSLA